MNEIENAEHEVPADAPTWLRGLLNSLKTEPARMGTPLVQFSGAASVDFKQPNKMVDVSIPASFSQWVSILLPSLVGLGTFLYLLLKKTLENTVDARFNERLEKLKHELQLEQEKMSVVYQHQKDSLRKVLNIFLHYVSDAQKFFTLRERKGLIEDGLFTRTRNPNYLGEILIYLSYAIMSMHWIPFVVLSAWVFGFFVRNMLRKDKSLARHPGFAEYKARTGLLFPSVFRAAAKPASSPQS